MRLLLLLLLLRLLALALALLALLAPRQTPAGSRRRSQRSWGHLGLT